MNAMTRRSVVKGLAGGGLMGILALAGTHEASAAKKSQKSNGKKDKKGQKLDGKEAQELNRLAEIAAAALTISGDSGNGRKGGPKSGRLALDEKKLDGLNKEQRSTLKRLVSDVNDGKLGFALKDESGEVVSLVGSEKALDEAGQDGDAGKGNGRYSWWSDAAGVYLYIDPFWTTRLRVFDRSAISFIAALIRNLWCNFRVACYQVATLVNFVYNDLISRIRVTGTSQSWVFGAWTGFAWVNAGRGWSQTRLRT